MAGLALMAAAALSGGLAWHAHQRWERETPPMADPNPVAKPVHAEQAARMPLPPASDVPLLLNRMQRVAREQGLGWPSADYRLNEATEDTPASLEVHCALKGTYPGIRRFLTALLQGAPMLTLREFSLKRDSAEVAEVEAKLSIVVYLAASPTAAAGVPGVTP